MSIDVSLVLFLNHVRERVVTPKYVDAPCILSLGNLLDSAPSGWFCWYIFTGELCMLSYVHVYGMFTFIRHYVNACVLLIWFACRSGIKVGWVPWCRCRKDIPDPYIKMFYRCWYACLPICTNLHSTLILLHAWHRPSVGVYTCMISVYR